MYLRVEENIVVNTKDIIGIFDMDNTTVSRLGRNFLAESQKNGLIINSTDDLPKSFVVVKLFLEQAQFNTPITPAS